MSTQKINGKIVVGPKRKIKIRLFKDLSDKIRKEIKLDESNPNYDQTIQELSDGSIRLGLAGAVYILKGYENAMHRWDSVYSEKYGSGHVHHFVDRQYRQQDMQQILQLVKNNEKLIMFPTNGNFGFAPVYVVAKLENILEGMKIEKENILYIGDKQLPKNQSFSKLSKLWKIPEKVNYLKRLNINIKNEDMYYY